MTADTSRPLILVSNDDGYGAEGIRALASAMAALGEVVVVSPATNQSATSHSMSLHKPLRLWEKAPFIAGDTSIPVWAVDGTPTDSVYLGVHHVLKGRRPDIVVAGINHGPNLGRDVIYSGTVAAAMEGVFLGIPGIAFSLVDAAAGFEQAAAFAQQYVQAVLASPPPPAVLLNVNVPADVTSKGYSTTLLGRHGYSTDVDTRLDPRGKPYFWIGGQWMGFEDLPGTDCREVAEGHISVTPIRVELTSHRSLSVVNQYAVDGQVGRPVYQDAGPQAGHPSTGAPDPHPAGQAPDPLHPPVQPDRHFYRRD